MSTDLLNAQAFQMTIVHAMLIFLIISAICIVIMLISISKQGDERRKFILSKTYKHTFLISIGILLADVSYYSLKGSPISILRILRSFIWE
jgi:hypothetical protein